MWPFARKDHSTEDAKSLAALEEFFAGASGTASKIAVSPTRALECPAVARGIAVRSEVLGMLPLHLFRRLNAGGKERAEGHALEKLLSGRPNGWTSAPSFLMQLERDSLLHDIGGIAIANRIDGSRIAELVRVKPGTVTLEEDASGEPRYLVSQKGGGQRAYHWRDVLHVENVGGISPIKLARESIGLTIAMNGHAGRLFGNGARPAGVLKSSRKLSPDVIARLKSSWTKAHTGDASGGTAILEDGIDFQALTFNSVDSQFEQMRQFQVVEIARGLGVPPSLLFDFGRATWGNAEQMAQSFMTFTVLPRLRLWAGAVSRLLSAEEQEQFFPEFIVDAVAMAELSARFAAYASAISSRILSPNEVRAMENRPPYEGGDKFENPNTTSGATNVPARNNDPEDTA